MDKIMAMNFEQENPEPVNPWKDSMFLQDSVKPISYELLIRPLLDYHRFHGREKITVEVSKKTTYFAVHAKELNIKNCSVICFGEKNVNFPVKSSFYYEPHDFYVIHLEKPAKPGFYSLDFDFEGNIKTKIEGFFKGNYFNERARASRPLAATKLKMAEARSVYPCFDEPHFKATFKIKIVRPVENYVAITNEVIEKEEFGPEKNEMTVFFKETKPISTFVTGFIIADLKESRSFLIDNMGETLTIKLHTAAEKTDKIFFAKELIGQIVKFFIHYFDMPFPVSKFDCVALPGFSESTIEQFGFTTFHENFLIFEEKINSAERMKCLALTIAQEICRQWFGCLVTMKLWSELWLVEGFVSLMKYRALNDGVNICSEWNLEEQLVLDVIQPVFDIDAKVGCYPLHAEVLSPQVLKSSSFIEIASGKGLAVLRMLEGLMGKDSFRKGTNRFLSKYLYASISISDFWDCLNNELNDPDMSLSSFMDVWTKQAGYPVIYVIKRANTWVISQSRFVSDRSSFFSSNESPYRYKWDVPLYYITSSDKKPILVWFRRSEDCLKITITDRTVSYLKFNYGQTGFYRVNYEGCLWKLFSQLLIHDHKTFDSIDRAGLLDDVFHLAEAGQTDYQYVFELVKYIEKDRDYLPWVTVSRNLKRLLKRFANSPHYSLLAKFVRGLVVKIYGYERGQYNWDSSPNDSFISRLFRREIIELACISKLPQCMNVLGEKFKDWISNGQIVFNPDLFDLVLCHGMIEVGTISDWEVVWNRYKKESNSNMKQLLLACLANTRDQSAVMTVLLHPNNEMTELEYLTYLRLLSQNLFCGSVHWNFIRNDFDFVKNRLSSRKHDLYDFIIEFTSKYYMRYQLEEVEAFLAKYPEVGADNNAKEAIITSINRNMIFVERNREIIYGWLTENLEV